eukprot:gi/632976175/ref/XP_007904649.1/ PREDICTED: ras-related protein Rab-26 [Callorhinchus milii]
MSRKKTLKSKGGHSSNTTSATAGGGGSEKSGGKGSGKALSNGGSVPSGAPESGAPESRAPLSGSGEFYDIAFKVMLVGDSGVGKTCLLVRFKDGAFLAGSFISTVGIDFRNKVLNVDGVKVKLQIWDTAGQERFRSVTHAYYRDAHALLLLYDVTNKTSFDNIQPGEVTSQTCIGHGPPSQLQYIKAWLTEIHEYATQDVVIMMLGNKADATQERAVKKESGEKLAKEYGVPFMETSAKTGLNVELAFIAIAKELKHRSMKSPSDPKFKLHDYVNSEMKGSGCCKS